MNGHTKPSSIELNPAEEFPARAGLFGHVPEEEYHDLEGRASSSVLRTILTESPAHAKAQMDDESDPTSAMRFGTMLHTAILEPSRFEREYSVATQCCGVTGSGSRCSYSGSNPWDASLHEPDGPPTTIWFCGTHEPDEPSTDPLDYECGYCGAEAGAKCVTESGREAEPHADRRGQAQIHLEETSHGLMQMHGPADTEELSESDHEKIEGMRGRLKEKQKARKLLFDLPGASEVTALWEHPGTKVLCKSRVDRIVEHEDLGVLAVDYKTTRDASPGPHGFGRSAMNHRYDVQAAFYLEALAKSGVMCDNFVFVAQEKSPPFDAVVHAIPNESHLMEKARHDMIEALRTYKGCAQSGTWPGYTGTEDQIQKLEVPHWHFDE